MKKIIYLLAWIGVALASCSDESSLPIQPEISAEPETPKDEPAPEKDYHQLHGLTMTCSRVSAITNVW